MQDKENLKLRAQPRQIVRINKSVIIAVGAAVVTAVLFGVINAFSVKDQTNLADSSIKVVTDKPIVMNSEVSDLPTSYTDVNGIRKYSFGIQNDELVKLQQQLEELKDAYGVLQSQLRNTSHEATKPVDDPQTEKARNSGLVFANLGGGAENLIGPNGERGSNERGSSKFGQSDESDVPATSKQEKYYREQFENKEKLATMKGDERIMPINKSPIMHTFSPYQVQRGTVIPATLVSSIDTTISGPVIAQVRQNIYDTVTGRYIVIPKGTKILGEYDLRSVKYGINRISIIFNTLVRPDGVSIVFDRSDGKPIAIAHDLQGRAGIVSNVNNHWGSVLGSALISTALSVGAAAAGGPINRDHDIERTRAWNGASQGISRVGEQLTSRALEVPPTITVDAGYQFNIILTKDVVLTPYNSTR